MMPITFQAAVLSADEEVKQQAAKQQMQELLELLSKGKKYTTLSTSDRKMLLDKGFASDLVDNLVFFTERNSMVAQETDSDQIVSGYTHAAFDPSLYACDSIKDALRRSHAGRCAYCENQLDHTGSACVSHFRPAWGVVKDGQWTRNAYYLSAYDQQNLFFSCHECNDVHKANQFPVYGQQAPEIESNHELPLLVNPYTDDPRQHIRFNPLNGQAYAYDEFSQFCMAYHEVPENQVETFIWQRPELIPQYVDGASDLLPTETNDVFRQWKQENIVKKYELKGQVTIDVLGLNRPALIRARLNRLSHLRGMFLGLQQESKGEAEKHSLNAYINNISSEANGQVEYRSLSIDAVNSWQQDKKHAQPWFDLYQKLLACNSLSCSIATQVSPRLSSSLQYMVLETELKLKDKRRIVNLHGSDYLYGSDRKVKTVFLPIDWERDRDNTIKVSSGTLLWESSFRELAQTETVALQNLFANNEVWAEGDYAPLA
ncbi:MAG: hypothetical protein ACRBHB_22135 [Arenicella sp.]